MAAASRNVSRRPVSSSRRVTPSMKSATMAGRSPTSVTSWTVTMPGWRSWAAARASRRKASRHPARAKRAPCGEPLLIVATLGLFASEAAVMDFQADQLAGQDAALGLGRRLQISFDPGHPAVFPVGLEAAADFIYLPRQGQGQQFRLDGRGL